MNSGGVRACPAPAGVPVAMMSPGSSVRPADSETIALRAGAALRALLEVISLGLFGFGLPAFISPHAIVLKRSVALTSSAQMPGSHAE